MLELTTTAAVFVLGIVIGSFLNVLIYRIPEGKNIAFPASHCRSCHTPLKWYHNIPLLSWLFLRGKCAFCDERIAARYPLVELLSGLLFVAIWHKIGFVWYLPFLWASFAALLVLIFIDIDYMAVPDSVNFFALGAALVSPHFSDAAKDAAIAAGGLYLIGLVAKLIARREALGGADVIVAGTMGALLGFPNFFIAIFLAALLAMIPSLVKRDSGVPFVPFLAVATFIVWYFDHQSMEIVRNIIYGQA